MSTSSRVLTAREGTALVTVLGAMLVLSAMGLALVLLAISQTLAAGNEQRASGALYAAEAGLERALPDLLAAPDWDSVLDGRVRSGFTDGAPAGARRLSDGRVLNLDELVAMANCGTAAACSDQQMDGVTADRPWGPNNPRWRLFAHGAVADLLSGGGPLPPLEYVVVLVADDASEVDGNPLRDGQPGASPGAGVLEVRAEAFGPQAAHRAVQLTVARGVARPAAGGYSAQRGQGTTANTGSGEVEVPGAPLTRSELTFGGGLNRR